MHNKATEHQQGIQSWLLKRFGLYEVVPTVHNLYLGGLLGVPQWGRIYRDPLGQLQPHYRQQVLGGNCGM